MTQQETAQKKIKVPEKRQSRARRQTDEAAEEGEEKVQSLENPAASPVNKKTPTEEESGATERGRRPARRCLEQEFDAVTSKTDRDTDKLKSSKKTAAPAGDPDSSPELSSDDDKKKKEPKRSQARDDSLTPTR